MTKVSISKCKVRQDIKWRVRWTDSTGVHRAFHNTQSGAESHASEIRGAVVNVNQIFAGLPNHDKEKLLMFYKETQRRGLDVLDLLAGAEAKGLSLTIPSVSQVITELIAVKQKAGRAERYTRGLKNILLDFADGKEAYPINRIGLAEVEDWLNKKNLISRSNFRGVLSTMFNFAIRRDYIIKNPCARLEAVTVVRDAPHVFTIEEVKTALKWLLKNPRLLGWFILSTFAGLRPEEAEKTSWQDINFEESWIRVKAQTTKTRQRRIVYPYSMAFDWLKVAKELHADLPVNRGERKGIIEQFRTVLGWTYWKKDVTRHTAASMWFAHCGSSDTVIAALGHSAEMLHNHYKALVTKVDAEAFWQLTPEAIKKELLKTE